RGPLRRPAACGEGLPLLGGRDRGQPAAEGVLAARPTRLRARPAVLPAGAGRGDLGLQPPRRHPDDRHPREEPAAQGRGWIRVPVHRDRPGAGLPLPSPAQSGRGSGGRDGRVHRTPAGDGAGVTGVRLGRRLVVTHLLVVAVSLLVLAAGAAAGLPTPTAVALAVGVGTVLGAVLALRTARWISGPLQEVGGALFTSLSGQDSQHLEEHPGDTSQPEEDPPRPEGHLAAPGRAEGHLAAPGRPEG